ncbi:ATP-binding protein [Aquabacterium sp.]|uniref:ATP-binding protein n=1 Tax=Aquabacterium sp. TaxID=1872578 RepID=UPI00248A5A8F|nr:ATP-binding protein [Aquabacterium sp.]MDI1261621.1 response regulator [Aquabacterium sp.]
MKPVPLGDVQFKVLQARIRMLFAHMPAACLVATSFSCLLAWLLLPTMGGQRVWAWLALKGLIAILLFGQSRLFSQSADPVHPKWYRGFLILLAIDGLVWGSVGWWMTPLARLDLMAVTLACLLGVASMGTFMLNPDAGSARAFIIPMLVPNAVFYLARQDSFGVFGGASVLAFVGLLFLETRWGQNRIEELLFLRYTTEEVAQERAKALALAHHHSEAKSRFLATMSHEMRTPLHGMLGLTRMLRDEELRPQAQQRLELVERSGEHLLSVINDVLDTSKIEAGHVNVERRPFDLSAVIHDVVAISTVNAQAKGLQLLLESTLPALHEVTGDAARVRQVLHNLLGNAVKFTDQGRITVRVSRVVGHDTVTLAVEDSGIGIPGDELPFIFEAFHQVESSMERRHGGAGLGLTISQKLCRAMGGDLRCTSSPGRGSVFVASFGLPVVARAQQVGPGSRGKTDEAPSDMLRADGRRGLVLLVEDNPINALVADAALKQFGLSVVLAEDGHKALGWLQDHQPDLVLMDCQMPGMDGFETTQHIRTLERQQARVRVPIVALTANVLPEERQRCLDAGMDDHLPKPFHRDDLTHLLAQHLPRGHRLSAMVTDGRTTLQPMA